MTQVNRSHVNNLITVKESIRKYAESFSVKKNWYEHHPEAVVKKKKLVTIYSDASAISKMR